MLLIQLNILLYITKLQTIGIQTREFYLADRTQSVNANGLESNSQLFVVFCIGYVWQTILHSDCKIYDDDGTVLFLYLLLPFQSGIAGNDMNLELSVRDRKEREKNIRFV